LIGDDTQEEQITLIALSPMLVTLFPHRVHLSDRFKLFFFFICDYFLYSFMFIHHNTPVDITVEISNKSYRM